MNCEILEARLVRLVGLGFSREDPPTDPLVSVPEHGDPPPIFTSVRSDSFQFGPSWVGRMQAWTLLTLWINNYDIYSFFCYNIIFIPKLYLKLIFHS